MGGSATWRREKKRKGVLKIKNIQTHDTMKEREERKKAEEEKRKGNEEGRMEKRGRRKERKRSPLTSPHS